MAHVWCGPSYSGGGGRRIAWTREVKVAVSQGHATALSLAPGDGVRLRLKKQNKKNPQYTYLLNPRIYIKILLELLIHIYVIKNY